MRDILDQLSDRLDKETNAIINFIDGKNEYSSDVFERVDVFMVQDGRPKSLRGYKGVYVFIITQESHVTYNQCKQWSNLSGAPFLSWKEQDIHKGDCWYLGSCASGSIYQRMGKHFSKKGNTTALNLNHPDRLFIRDMVRVYAFPLRREFDRYAKLIVTSVEDRLHRHYSPIVGTSRT